MKTTMDKPLWRLSDGELGALKDALLSDINELDAQLILVEDEISCRVDIDEPYCAACNGTGEGMYDGSSCSSCGGSGVPRRERDR